jgi:probable HAF family extracellular repeat protein
MSSRPMVALQSHLVLGTCLALALTACASEVLPTDPSNRPDQASSPRVAETGANPYSDALDLGTLGGTRAYAHAINSAGQVVGGSTLANGNVHAFLWANGVMTDLGTLGGDYSEAFGINDHGDIVGVSKTADGKTHGVWWNKRVPRDLGTIGNRPSAALDVNNHDQIVGGADEIALLWRKKRMTRLPSPSDGTHCGAFEINASGRAIGQCTINNSARAVLWDRGRAMNLGTLGGTNSTATGINASGAVVGISFITFDNGSHPFVWRRGTMTDLTTLGADFRLIPNAINDAGQIAGHYGGGDRIHGAVFEDGKMIELPGTTVDTYVDDINRLGHVVGYTVVGNAYHAILWRRSSQP